MRRTILKAFAVACTLGVTACAGSPVAAVGTPPSQLAAAQRLGSKPDTKCSSYSHERAYAVQYLPEFNNTILVIAADTHSPTMVLCQLTYSLLSHLTGIADDATGKLWALVSEARGPELMVFAHGADGADPPVQVIAGSHTLLKGVGQSQFLGVDHADNVWVTNQDGYVMAFRNNAHGNATPVTTIGYADRGHGERIPWPISVAFDDKGYLYVANYTLPGTVTVFKPPFSDNESPVTVWTLQDVLPQSISSDENGNIYLGTDCLLLVFKHGLASQGIPTYQFSLETGGARGCSYDTTVDQTGRIFMGLLSGGPSGQNGIGVLPRNARSMDQAVYLTGNMFDGPPSAIAVGR